MTIKKRKKGYFSISAVSEMFSIHQQTIRLYEKEGLIQPKRSEGNTRLFSEEDVNRLEEVIYLTHTMGINLAGVEMILKLQKQIKKMQYEMNDLFKQMNKDLDEQVTRNKNAVSAVTKQMTQLRRHAQTKKLVEKPLENLQEDQGDSYDNQ